MINEDNKKEESWKELILEWMGSIFLVIILAIVFMNDEILKLIFWPFSALSHIFGIGLTVSILIIAAYYLRIIK